MHSSKSQPPLVIWGSAHDPHLWPIACRLEETGVQVFFLEPLGNIELTLSLASGQPGFGVCARRLDGELQRMDKPFLLWLRNKIRRNVIRNERDQSEAFSLWERDAFVEALVQTLPARHFNDLHSMRRHASKPLQLKIAQKVGFKCPPTIVSNVKDEILAFARLYKSVIVKPLHRAFVSPSLDGKAPARTIFANSCTAEEIAAVEPESLLSAPMIIQEEINKESEIRLIVFGNSSVTYNIDSQKSIKGFVDWRRASGENIFNETYTDSCIKKISKKYLKYMGLSYGVFDFIKTNYNEYIFLECNADGQWAWLESKDERKSVTNIFVKEIRNMIDIA